MGLQHERARWPLGWVQIGLLVVISMVAFAIRLFSVLRFESVIHEFDPWFNFRATKYLVQHGWYAFLNWFDERAWYPLGRIVGGTVYPGIMVTSAVIHYLFNSLLALSIDIRDVCVFLAPLFSALTVIATFLVTRELQNSHAALLSAALIAICPGYISRSVAGSYDNEGIAIFLMMATFYWWLRAIRGEGGNGSVRSAIAAAFCYFYMASAWGGYVFVINLIPLHVLILLLMGRYSHRLYMAYCIFYVLGTLASMTVPLIGLQPLRSSEHMAALGVFGLLQLMAFVETVRSYGNFEYLTRKIILVLFLASLLTLVSLTMAGYVTPWTGRFYSLWDTDYARKFIPIIASVSEHQPTTWACFFFDFNLLMFTAPVGLYLCLNERRDEQLFAVVYALTAVYFAGVMVRLILTLTPIMCILGAMGMSHLLDVYLVLEMKEGEQEQQEIQSKQEIALQPLLDTETLSKINTKETPLMSQSWDNRLFVIGPFLLLMVFYVWHCTWVTATAYSSPSIILSSTDPTRTGQPHIIDDFREAYYWLRRNTPLDAKILAWWDYGYQLAGMADRTTIVDNNTWNNTHIATVGKVMALPEERAYPILRHLDVDYLLILSGTMSGFAGDDLNKFLWMVRIAEGVFPEEIKERDYLLPNGDYRLDAGAPTILKESLLYKMTYYDLTRLLGHNLAYDRARKISLAGVDPQLSIMVEAYATDNMLVRIFHLRSPDTLGRSLFSLDFRDFSKKIE